MLAVYIFAFIFFDAGTAHNLIGREVFVKRERERELKRTSIRIRAQVNIRDGAAFVRRDDSFSDAQRFTLLFCGYCLCVWLKINGEETRFVSSVPSKNRFYNECIHSNPDIGKPIQCVLACQ